MNFAKASFTNYIYIYIYIRSILDLFLELAHFFFAISCFFNSHKFECYFFQLLRIQICYFVNLFANILKNIY